MKRKKIQALGPYPMNPDISVEPTLTIGAILLEKDVKFRLKGQRNTYKFIRVAFNAKLNSRWVDCMDTDTGEFRSFRIEEIFTPRKRRKK